MASTTIARLLDTKGYDVWSIGPTASVYDAIALMAEKGVGALPVVDVDGKNLIGIISERDYARKVILKGRVADSTQVQEIMTPDVITARPEDSVERCMEVMTDNRIRHLPVMDGDRLIGIISIGDLVKAIISGQDDLIQRLEGYITGH